MTTGSRLSTAALLGLLLLQASPASASDPPASSFRSAASASSTSDASASRPSAVPASAQTPFRRLGPGAADLVPATRLAAAATREPAANTLLVPRQILRTGIDLNSNALSSNAKQLADQLKLTPLLERIDNLRSRVSDKAPTIEGLAARQELLEAVQDAHQIIQEADLAVDFTVAEINAEVSVVEELHSTYQSEANKAVQWANWGSYYSNGALWAVAEALDIPTWKRPKYAIPSGTCGIIAGVIPSFASLWAMHASSGKKHPIERDPNMLAKLFDLQNDKETDYPQQVWAFLKCVPPDEKTNKSRIDVLIDRWVADKNIPSFTDRSSKDQIELVSGLTSARRGGTISLMETRHVMLSQLAAEVMKEKRLLYELSMAVHGEKKVQVAETGIPPL